MVPATPEAHPGQSRHVVVIGGGLAGLVAALDLGRAGPDMRVTLLEATDRVGGKLALAEVAGHRVDVGAEAMLALRPEGVDLIRDLGAGDDIVAPRRTRCDSTRRACDSTSSARAGRYWPSTSRTSSASTATAEEVEDDDMANSGLCRAGLPETGAPRRSAAVRVRRRPQAASARPSGRADLDGENGVVAWVDTASPPTLPHQRARPT